MRFSESFTFFLPERYDIINSLYQPRQPYRIFINIDSVSRLSEILNFQQVIFMIKAVFAVGTYDKKSGIVKVVYNIAKALAAKKEYDVTILCTGMVDPDKPEMPDGLSYYNMDIEKYGHRKKYFRYVKSVKKALADLNPDIAIVSGTEHVPFYSSAVKNMPSGAPKLFVWEHLNFDAGPKFRLEWIGKRLAVKKWDGIICITKKDYAAYSEYAGSRKKVHQIYNLTDFPTEVRKPYDIESKKIISVGYLAHIKGFDMLVSVAKKVFARHSDWVWDIYGEGTEREYLQNLIDSNGLERNVFLKGYHDKINSLYGEYAFFVLTSRAEGMGMVLIEAQKSGLPCVSFDIKCGPSDVITDGLNGYLIEPFAIDKMAEKINMLIENANERLLFSDNSEINLKDFSENIIVDKWDKLLKNILSPTETDTSDNAL